VVEALPGRADHEISELGARALVDRVLVDAGLNGKLSKEARPNLERKGSDWVVTPLALREAPPAVAAHVKALNDAEASGSKLFYGEAKLYRYRKGETTLYLVLVHSKDRFEGGLGSVPRDPNGGLESTDRVALVPDTKYGIFLDSPTGARHGVRWATYSWSLKRKAYRSTLSDWSD
jgi:hypothetical protein